MVFRLGQSTVTEWPFATGSTPRRFSDIAVLSAEQALNGEEDRLSAIAEKYDAIGTLVTVAELDIDPRTGAPSIQVSMTRFGKADTGRVFVRSFAGTHDRGVDVLLKDAVEALSLIHI